jgi:hypothetical protein
MTITWRILNHGQAGFLGRTGSDSEKGPVKAKEKIPVG